MKNSTQKTLEKMEIHLIFLKHTEICKNKEKWQVCIMVFAIHPFPPKHDLVSTNILREFSFNLQYPSFHFWEGQTSFWSLSWQALILHYQVNFLHEL